MENAVNNELMVSKIGEPSNQSPLSIQNALLFVALIEPQPAKQPVSDLARIWNACLGPNPIPFDPTARQELTTQGYQHPGLKPHIDMWKELKQNGSRWATGSFNESEGGVFP